MKNSTQSELILKHLQQGEPITALDALEYYKCFRLAARIHDLRKKGYKIISKKLTCGNGKHVSSYEMEVLK